MSARPLRCLVYADPMSLVEFSKPEGSSLIREISRSFGEGVRIDLAKSEDVRSGSAFQDGPDIFVLPGIFGQTSLYPDHIGPDGNAQILAFIERGGTFLGVCAGAYYAAQHIVYDPAWGPRKERHEGTLGIFNGMALGPIRGRGRTTHDTPETFHEEISHVDPLPITIEDGPMKGQTFEVAYGLGPAFHCAADAKQKIGVIARYADADENPPAIIDIPIGRGHAILSGVLPQFGYEEDPANYSRALAPNLNRLLASLYRHRHDRTRFWDYLMTRVADHHGVSMP